MKKKISLECWSDHSRKRGIEKLYEEHIELDFDDYLHSEKVEKLTLPWVSKWNLPDDGPPVYGLEVPVMKEDDFIQDSMYRTDIDIDIDDDYDDPPLPAPPAPVCSICFKHWTSLHHFCAPNATSYAHWKMLDLFMQPPFAFPLLRKVLRIKRLPTSVLNGKSPYELVYDRKPNLSHLRSFGCLCFSTVLNNSDKFTSRSSRVSKLPAKLNDYVVDSKLKYGLEKHVSYAKLNTVNYCFTTTFNKSVEPTSYYEAAKDLKWIEAMNEEIDALYRNYTWTIVDLSKGRKAIGNEWIL
nr:ribonuclease H-like domain-containing protein [Tanacetum cinerariifolium]